MKLKYKYMITKIRTKTRHNILWIKIPAEKSGSANSKDLYLALVYCRTDNYEDEVTAFFSLLAHDSLMFSELGEILVMGDFNSRLGEYTGDRTSSGKWATNKNALAFRSYLEATNLVLLNREHAYGKPTFSRPGAASNSIIDFVLATPQLANKCAAFAIDVLDTGHYHSHNNIITLKIPTTIPTTETTNQPHHYYEKIGPGNCDLFFETAKVELDHLRQGAGESGTRLDGPELNTDPVELELLFLTKALNYARAKVLKKKCKSGPSSGYREIPRFNPWKKLFDDASSNLGGCTLIAKELGCRTLVVKRTVQ